MWYPEWNEEFESKMSGDSSSGSSDTCASDQDYTDSYGDDCVWYGENPDSCGEYDDGTYTANEACCACGGGFDESEVIWEGYLVDPYGSGDYAYLWVEDPEMSEIYYWNDEEEAYCVLKPDWKNDTDPEAGIWGFFVTDPLDMCPYVDQGWEYAWYTEDEYDETMTYIQVPSGDMWLITDEETYYMYYYTEDDQDWYYDDDEEMERETYVDE
jgi:hypothetical protein